MLEGWKVGFFPTPNFVSLPRSFQKVYSEGKRRARNDKVINEL